MPKKLRVDQVNFVGKRVLLRTDYNVPMNGGKIASNQRIKQSLETINYMLKNHCQSIVIISHLGRPEGVKDYKYSLKPISEELKSLLGRDVTFLDDCVGPEIEMAVMEPEEGSVFLLENLRFHIEEIGVTADRRKKADPRKVVEFRRSLRRMAEIYVNDSFGSSHREHSSMLGEGYEVRAAGFLVIRELDFFYEKLLEPERPFLAILGGARVQPKIKVIEALLEKVNEIIIGGGMAMTFMKIHLNMRIGDSVFDERGAEKVPEIMMKAQKHKVQIHFPEDFVTGRSLDEKSDISRARKEQGIKKGYMALDIGPRSLKKFAKIIRRAKILLWNGTMGAYENSKFAHGTKEMIALIIDQTVAKGITIVSGEGTIVCCERYKAIDEVSYISTGGNATLALLQGEHLPGIDSLRDEGFILPCENEQCRERLPGIDYLCDEEHRCRQRCEVYQVIRPKLEYSPFGEVDVDKILEERRKERKKQAKKVEEERKEKEQGQQGQEGKQGQGQQGQKQGQQGQGQRQGQQGQGQKQGQGQGQRQGQQGQGQRQGQGSQGQQGSQAKQGSQGQQGSQAKQGSQGQQGSQAKQGSQGQQGSQAKQGSQMSQGSKSKQGSQMSQGSKASQGSQAKQGSKAGSKA